MSIHQDVVINGSPKAVYEILLSAKKFKTMTGGREAKIAKEVGGEISLFGGAIQGRHVELVPGKRSGDWEDGVYSIVRFELIADGAKTKLSFDHTGYPAKAQADLESGWHKMYWLPMNSMLADK
jgi:activator of HSP90 ATPase